MAIEFLKEAARFMPQPPEGFRWEVRGPEESVGREMPFDRKLGRYLKGALLADSKGDASLSREFYLDAAGRAMDLYTTTPTTSITKAKRDMRARYGEIALVLFQDMGEADIAKNLATTLIGDPLVSAEVRDRVTTMLESNPTTQ